MVASDSSETSSIKLTSAGSLVMLMSVNADGTVEFVEGVVDPVTGEILGAFKELDDNSPSKNDRKDPRVIAGLSLVIFVKKVMQENMPV